MSNTSLLRGEVGFSFHTKPPSSPHLSSIDFLPSNFRRGTNDNDDFWQRTSFTFPSSNKPTYKSQYNELLAISNKLSMLLIRPSLPLFLSFPIHMLSWCFFSILSKDSYRFSNLPHSMPTLIFVQYKTQETLAQFNSKLVQLAVQFRLWCNSVQFVWTTFYFSLGELFFRSL